MPALLDAMEVIATEAALQDLLPEWQALWESAPDSTPFQSPAWLLPWWRHVGEGRLLVLALRDEGRLVGLAPFYIYTEPSTGQRKLFPLGIGTTDYLDMLAAPGREVILAQGVMRALDRNAAHFDQAEWPQLRPGSVLLGPVPRGWRALVEPAEPCPVLTLPPRADALAEVVSRKTLRDLRTVRRRAAEAGVERWHMADAGDIGQGFDALLRLHAARWQSRGGEGVLADARVQAMHREALPRLARAGLLRFLTLHGADGAVVAALYALADPPARAPRRLYLYISGFDPALDRLSPGMLLVGRAVDLAFAEGFAEIDFLRGRERYKSFWGARETPTLRRVLTPPLSGREDAACAPC